MDRIDEVESNVTELEDHIAGVANDVFDLEKAVKAIQGKLDGIVKVLRDEG
jgi:uncharacterized coiled-coil protein SlyX